MFVGNDIVDITLPYAQKKAKDVRFLTRVFNSQERVFIEKASHPDLVLWALWAAKETAFKIGQKLNSGLSFGPQKFVVYTDPLLEAEGQLTNEDKPVLSFVDYGKRHFPIRWNFGQGYVHCVGLSSSDKKVANDNCRVLFSVADIKKKGTFLNLDESASVRLLAEELVSKVYSGEFEIIRKQHSRMLTPPMVYTDGNQVKGLDLSMSHDGNFVAAAVCSVNS